MPPKSPPKAKAEATEEHFPEASKSVPSTARSEDIHGLDSARDTATPRAVPGVSMTSLMRFVFPPSQAHPESTGRLELFARYGPCDEEGQLLGGRSGRHKHLDFEIHHMIKNNIREAMFVILKRPRDVVEALVDSLLPLALEENMSRAEVRKLLRDVHTEEDGGMCFHELQDKVFATQRKRLKAIIEGFYRKKEKGPKVPFQNKQTAALMSVTFKKKMSVPEGNYAQEKRLHAYATTLSTLEDCSSVHEHVNQNVRLCRHLGDVDDRWDRYCAVRRVGRAGYVKAKHSARACVDDGLADKYPGCSSLVSASIVGAATSQI